MFTEVYRTSAPYNIGGNSSKLREKCGTFMLLYLVTSPYVLAGRKLPVDKESFSVVKASHK